MRIVVAGLCLALVAAVSAQEKQQQPRATFRSSVEMVLVDVSVLDSARRPVRGLTPDDFTVTEDGKPQQITSFTAIDLPDVQPATVSWMREVTPDVKSNEDAADRRILVVVMDDATPMPGIDVRRAKEMARAVVSRMGPADLAAVVFTFNKKQGQDFTQDHSRLLAAIDKFSGNVVSDGDLNWTPLLPKPKSSPTSVEVPQRKFRFDEFDPSALTMYEATVGTLRDVADSLGALPNRRKALVFVSVGLPLDASAAVPREDLTSGDDGGTVAKRLLESMRDTFAAAQRSNVNIYSMDPGGLRAGMPTMNQSGFVNSVGQINQDFLEAVSENTGGFRVKDSNKIDEGISQIYTENGSYYLIGYESTNTRADGRFRRIEVRANRPGLTIRSRHGYYEQRGDKPAAASDNTLNAASGLVPKSDVLLQMSASPLAAPGSRDTAVAIVVTVRQPPPAVAEKATDNVDVHVAAFDTSGKLRKAERVTMHVNIAGQPDQAIAYELLSRLDLPPGRYQIRVAATSSLQSRSGSLYYDIDVPDFSKPALSMSAVLLTATPGMLSAPKGRLADLVPVTPTALREFAPGDQVSAFVRLYEGGKGEAGAVSLSVRILDAQGGTAFEATQTLDAAAFARDRAADYRLDLPIDKLQAGAHLFTIEAKLGKGTVRRDVRFTISR